MKWNIMASLLEKEDGRKTNQYLAVLTATITVFVGGMHLGWSGASISKITSPDFAYQVTEEEASYIVIIGGVGHVLGGSIFSILQDLIGRKKAVLSIGIPQILAFTLIYFSNHGVALLYIARILSGMGEGANIAILPTYISEVAEPKVRGSLGTFVTLIYVLGALFLNVVGSYLDIHTAALVCVIFPVIFLVTFSFMPDSPYYLLMKNDTENARKCLRILRRSKNVDKELMQLSTDVKRQMSESGTYKDLFNIDSNRKALFLAVILRVSQQFTGYNAFLMYSQQLLSQATNFSPVLGSSMLFIAQMSVTVVSTFFIDRFGRKVLLSLSCGLCCAALTAQTIFFTIRDYSNLDVSSLSWLPLLILVFYIVSFASGLGVAVNIFISEIYSTSIKAKGLAIGSIAYATGQIISAKFYQYTADNLGLIVPFSVFAICSFCSTLFYALVLPETKGKRLEEIQQELKGNIGKSKNEPTLGN